MKIVTHKVCSGPALETNSLEAEITGMVENDFPFTCFTCLDEVVDRSEIRMGEQLGM